LQPEPAPISAPMPSPAPRSYRPASTEEPWVASEAPAPRSRPESGNGMSANFSAKLGGDFSAQASRPAPQVAPQVSPPLRETPAVEPSAASQTDNNLAEMAQRLEAALRRPPMGEPHAPVTDPLGAAFTAPSEAKFDFKAEPKFEPKTEAKFEPKFEPKFETKPMPAKSSYDSLEQEMASLLGRPSGKT
jgi:flagellar protein FliO/FliZ